MEKISRLLDEFGFSTWGSDHLVKQSQLFAWMTEATNRIQELQYEVAKLKGEVDAQEGS
jgi:hypothetical protein